LKGFAFRDLVAHGGHGNQGLEGGHPALAVGLLDQRLRHDAHQVDGQLDPDLLLLVRGEHVNDPVHGLHGVGGVERGEHQVSPFQRR
jgi:hypothetical protein